METLILKENNKEIRQALKSNNIKVCVCTTFKNALWLDYNGSVTNLVHGVGYCDETCPAPPEQVLKCFVNECNNPKFCKDVKEFITNIKEQQKLCNHGMDKQ